MRLLCTQSQIHTEVERPYKLTRQMVLYLVLQVYSHVSEVQITVANANTHTHTQYNFPKPCPSRQRPCFDLLPQLIKAYSTGIPQYFSSVTLSSLSGAYLSLSAAISCLPLYPVVRLLFQLSSLLCFFSSCFLAHLLSLSDHLHFLSLRLCRFCSINKPQFRWY